jgi:hypothetical protein
LICGNFYNKRTPQVNCSLLLSSFFDDIEDMIAQPPSFSQAILSAHLLIFFRGSKIQWLASVVIGYLFAWTIHNIFGSWDSQYLFVLIILCCSIFYLARAILRRHALRRTADNKSLDASGGSARAKSEGQGAKGKELAPPRQFNRWITWDVARSPHCGRHISSPQRQLWVQVVI